MYLTHEGKLGLETFHSHKIEWLERESGKLERRIEEEELVEEES